MEGGHIVQYGKPEAIVLNPANEYVAEFVAHMNPLNVLRGGSLMTPVEELKREGDAVLLDRAGRFRVKLNAAGGPEAVTIDRYLGRLMPHQSDMALAALPYTPPNLAPCAISMRAAIELRQAPGAPVALFGARPL